jgi:hypothetical protein
MMLAAGYTSVGTADGVVFWDVANRERLGTPTNVDEGVVVSASFAPYGKTLAAIFARTRRALSQDVP